MTYLLFSSLGNKHHQPIFFWCVLSIWRSFALQEKVLSLKIASEKPIHISRIKYIQEAYKVCRYIYKCKCVCCMLTDWGQPESNARCSTRDMRKHIRPAAARGLSIISYIFSTYIWTLMVGISPIACNKCLRNNSCNSDEVYVLE